MFTFQIETDKHWLGVELHYRYTPGRLSHDPMEPHDPPHVEIDESDVIEIWLDDGTPLPHHMVEQWKYVFDDIVDKYIDDHYCELAELVCFQEGR